MDRQCQLHPFREASSQAKNARLSLYFVAFLSFWGMLMVRDVPCDMCVGFANKFYARPAELHAKYGLNASHARLEIDLCGG